MGQPRFTAQGFRCDRNVWMQDIRRDGGGGQHLQVLFFFKASRKGGRAILVAMPIREPRMMTGDEIREQLSFAGQIGCRVQSARRGMIHSSATRFDMRLRIKTRLAPDIALEGGRVLTEVMPQTGQSSPLRGSKLLGKTSG